MNERDRIIHTERRSSRNTDESLDRTVLIVTNSEDLHADMVMERIAAKGAGCFRLDLDRFPVDYAVDLNLDGAEWSGVIRHVPSDRTITVHEIGAVWARKTAPFAFSGQGFNAQEKAFATQETEQVLLGLMHSLDCYWMSHPVAGRSALWKLEQLQRAARFGFSVPPTIVTSRADSVARFSASNADGTIFKTLSSPYLGAEQVDPEQRITAGIGTTLLTDEHMEMIDSVETLPSHFQRYIPKQYELRATVIGNRIFTAKIHSQDDERTKIDFRDFSVPIRYEAETLPAEIAQRCIDFVHSYGLQYGAIDLIATPQGEYVFLENNPAGQFLFVEQLVPELKMIDAVADCLIEGARGKTTDTKQVTI